MTTNEDLRHLPVLPIKNTVLFPHLVMPLAAGRPASRAAVEAALASEEDRLASKPASAKTATLAAPDRSVMDATFGSRPLDFRQAAIRFLRV